MRSLATATNLSETDLWTAAANLAGDAVTSLSALGGGANNRVYRADTENGVFALKSFMKPTSDCRDRLGAELAALTFLAEMNETAAPRIIASDRQAGLILFEWIEGSPIFDPGSADIDAAAAFAQRLKKYSDSAQALALKPAAEACHSAAEIARQVRNRMTQLSTVAHRHTDLAKFLDQVANPALERSEQRARRGFTVAGIDFEADQPHERLTLSPSDFGFHNALRRPDGTIAFVDFEYFGWDQPLRLVADFILHPGMTLSTEQQQTFSNTMINVFMADDQSFATRLDLCLPLVGLRWSMIILNEFLPNRRQQRDFAGTLGIIEETQARQLAKARNMLRRVEQAMTDI
jgi:hypothetical protein